jgi:hypothetical protein
MHRGPPRADGERGQQAVGPKRTPSQEEGTACGDSLESQIDLER